MCGIAGYISVDLSRPVDSRVLRAMTDALGHRGPDDEGFHVQSGVALGHAAPFDHRPSHGTTADLERGWQASGSSSTGRCTTICHLRDDLISRGHRFKTRSDTEVLVHLYEERGDEFVTEINAMAALALWDVGGSD